MSEFFPFVGSIAYEGPKSDNPLSYKWYNPDEVILGKTMTDHLRCSVTFWNTFVSAGSAPLAEPTLLRLWHASPQPVERAKNSLRAAFEFVTKLGIDFYCFHDADISPAGDTLAETQANLDQIVHLARELQNETGVNLLWNTSNLFSHPRFCHGAATSPDAGVFACAAAQVKKMLEVAVDLEASNYLFRGGREGYETLLNTDMRRERDHLAYFLQLAVDYANTIGFTGQLLIESKPKEPMKHQYDYDAATVIGFLTEYGLKNHFKLNVEANRAALAGHTFEHELTVAASHGLLGSVDANRGDLLLGWDTDQYLTEIASTTGAMLVILRVGGLGRGGLNFDAKVRRGSVDLEDLFHAHIGAIDAFALGLRAAARILADGRVDTFVKERYASYNQGIGARIESRTTSLEELAAYALSHPEPVFTSGRQEYLENLVNQLIASA